MSNIREALAKIYTIQDALAISAVTIQGQSVSKDIIKVWELQPPGRTVINDTPCFVNRVPESRTQYMSSLTRSNFTVNMQLIVHDVDSNFAGEIALAFYPKIVTAFSQNIKLGLSGWMVNELRTEGDMLRVFDELTESSGKTLVGLDLFLDLTWQGTASHAAGA